MHYPAVTIDPDEVATVVNGGKPRYPESDQG